MFCVPRARRPSVRCSAADPVIDEARRSASGSAGWRQPGCWRPAPSWPLNMVERRDDHARAQRLAVALAERFPVGRPGPCAPTSSARRPTPANLPASRRGRPRRHDRSKTVPGDPQDIDDADIARTIAASTRRARRRRAASGRPATKRRLGPRTIRGRMRVLITGCSSGFGRGAAIDSQAHEVIATAAAGGAGGSRRRAALARRGFDVVASRGRRPDRRAGEQRIGMVGPVERLPSTRASGCSKRISSVRCA
jgi:hypothetical protein